MPQLPCRVASVLYVRSHPASASLQTDRNSGDFQVLLSPSQWGEGEKLQNESIHTKHPLLFHLLQWKHLGSTWDASLCWTPRKTFVFYEVFLSTICFSQNFLKEPKSRSLLQSSQDAAPHPWPGVRTSLGRLLFSYMDMSFTLKIPRLLELGKSVEWFLSPLHYLPAKQAQVGCEVLEVLWFFSMM